MRSRMTSLGETWFFSARGVLALPLPWAAAGEGKMGGEGWTEGGLHKRERERDREREEGERERGGA